MPTEPEHGSWLPRLLQLFDSACPTGAYAHSLGLESLVQAGEVDGLERFEVFLREAVTASLVRVDLPLIRLACEAQQGGEVETLSRLDALAQAVRPTREQREAGQRMGRQLLRLATALLGEGAEALTLQRAGEHLPYQQLPVVTGLLSAQLAIPLVPVLEASCQQAFNLHLQAAVKLLRLGPTQAQCLLFSLGGEVPALVEASRNMAVEDIGYTHPLWDLHSARHERAHSRLFIS